MAVGGPLLRQDPYGLRPVWSWLAAQLGVGRGPSFLSPLLTVSHRVLPTDLKPSRLPVPPV